LLHSTSHTYTNDHQALDFPHKALRRVDGSVPHSHVNRPLVGMDKDEISTMAVCGALSRVVVFRQLSFNYRLTQDGIGHSLSA